jgi:glutamyl-tRNA synthetase/glutamyl-Q tRNA(Asp) synthetase
VEPRTPHPEPLPVSRYAPAPTGYLHLGHVVNAVYVWGMMGNAGGRVTLRIEDHDAQRSRPEFERAILEDLEWLGFMPDDPPIAAFRAGRCMGRQSDRHAVYEATLNGLRAKGLVYACECSRSDIVAASSGEGELRYPGTCAGKRLDERAGLGLRLRLAPSVERFDDLRHGRIEQRPSEQCGDVLVRDRDGNWTYQFAAAVDDAAQGVTHVIRGDDLLPSTGRQIQIARLIGRAEPPVFLHHPLIMKTPTQKLSKADRDTSVRDMRAAGVTAAEVIGRAVAAVGLLPAPRAIGAGTVATLFGDSTKGE